MFVISLIAIYNYSMKKYLYYLIALVILTLVVWGIIVESTKPGKYDDFAVCLKNKGAEFYGAFWCPHCQAQKKLFGKSAKLLPYIECSTADGQGQTKICKDKKIEGYPTWNFADGSTLSGEVPLKTLADKTSCILPN